MNNKKINIIDSGKVNIIADIKGVDNKMPGVDNNLVKRKEVDRHTLKLRPPNLKFINYL